MFFNNDTRCKQIKRNKHREDESQGFVQSVGRSVRQSVISKSVRQSEREGGTSRLEREREREKERER